MTVAVPCANCGAIFAAGHGHLCPKCRGGYAPGELRIPQHDPDECVPVNQAAIDARAKRGLPPHPDAARPGESMEDAVMRLLGY